MNLHLETLDHSTAYRPGEWIEGVAGWEGGSGAPVEVRLVWHTSGRADPDDNVVDRVVFERPKPADAQVFRLRAPVGPYSFTGGLITLTWTVELLVRGGDGGRQLDVVISPTGDTIRL